MIAHGETGNQILTLYKANIEKDKNFLRIKALNKKPKKNKNWNPKKPDPSTGIAPFKIINLGSSKKIKLMEYIRIIEKILGKKAIIKFSKLQKVD